MRIACVKCQAQYMPKKLGVSVVETSGTPPRATRVWQADILACPICGNDTLSHFSHAPVMESHEKGFDVFLASIPAESRFVLYSPELLASRVGYETKYVRSNDSNRLRTTDR